MDVGAWVGWTAGVVGVGIGVGVGVGDEVVIGVGVRDIAVLACDVGVAMETGAVNVG